MIQIVPAIDIIGAKCVRLSKGDYASTKVYNEQPLEVAKQFEDCGCRRLHLVDLDGAVSHHVINHRILEQIASRTNLIIDFGGGIKSEEDAHIAFDCGASMITGGSIALKNPILFERLILKYGPERIILGADANHGKIAVNGWTEDSDTEIVPFIKHMMEHNKVQKVISTDIECDGMLKGPSLSNKYHYKLSEYLYINSAIDRKSVV